MARLLVLLIVVSAPPATLGGYLWGWKGALAGFVVTDVLLIFAAFRAERVLIRKLRASPGTPAGLDTTLRRTHEDLMNEDAFRYTVPGVAIYPDPVPNALTVRAMGSRGTILLSQGLLTALTEQELRAVLRESIRRNDESEWLFNSLVTSLAVRTLGLFPSGWRKALFSGANASGSGDELGTLKLIPVLWLLPMARFFLGLCGRVSILEFRETASADLVTAMRKSRAAAARSGLNPVPGSSPLHLVDPAPADRILG